MIYLKSRIAKAMSFAIDLDLERFGFLSHEVGGDLIARPQRPMGACDCSIDSRNS